MGVKYQVMTHVILVRSILLNSDAMNRKPPFFIFGFLIITVTVMLWWGFAFLPLPDSAPTWVEQARWVCFGLRDNGLPQNYGWMMLIGAPLMMISALWIGWGNEWDQGKIYLRQNKSAFITAILLLVVLVAESHFVGKKITAALRLQSLGVQTDSPDQLKNYSRLAQTPPALHLYDKNGQLVTLEMAKGKVLYVTFAFAHCKAVCPTLVEKLKRVHEEVGHEKSAVYIISLDPWRDTIAALADMHKEWNLPETMHVLSGSPDEVNRVLDAFNIPRSRDEKTGEVVHPALVDVIDPEGRLSYIFNGASQKLLIEAGKELL